MRQLTPQQAVRRGQKARVLVMGPSGAGKTFTSLQIARVLVGPDGKIVVIDTENGSASLYADKFSFDVVEWRPPFDPKELEEAIQVLGAKYDAVVNDSMSHFWFDEGGTLDIVDAAASKFRGNSFSGWKEGTPAQRKLMNSILRCPAHFIGTVRSKTEWVLQENERGQKVPKRIGTAPIQRDDVLFEFTVAAEMDLEHNLIISKTRCDLLDGKTYRVRNATENPAAMAQTLRGWLESAEAVTYTPRPEPQPATAPDPVLAGPKVSQDQIKRLWTLAKKAHGESAEDKVREALRDVAGVEHTKDIPQVRYNAVVYAVTNEHNAA